MCFVWIWEQTAIISLYSINWLVFITETECVYCAVRTSNAVPWLRRLVACLSSWIPEFDRSSVWIRFVVDKLALWQVFLGTLQYSPVNIIPLMLHTHLLLPERQTGKPCEPYKKEWNVENRGTLHRKKNVHFFSLQRVEALLGSLHTSRCLQIFGFVTSAVRVIINDHVILSFHEQKHIVFESNLYCLP